ncbi:kinase-like domain-containing protein, partial [Mycena latifolia]
CCPWNHFAVQYGGFADIYHGQYTNSEGEDVQVALKVLKVFPDQSDPTRHLILRKFAKEALVWHYLRHPNIVPFIGVDATTFPTPMMAMVSSWMSQGGVLQYMRKNSPMSRYAITLLNDIIQGLMYLHSENILHGDLCGRNILIKERRACLTDFGLAAFIQSNTSIKTSTRSGSTRWMAPELLLPTVYDPGHSCQTSASDVWAFGCVCCEVCTFSVKFRSSYYNLFNTKIWTEAIPYPTRPCDKAGIVMPERLWELVRRCFALHAAERPTVHVIAAMLDEIQLGKPTGTESSNISTANEVALRAPGVTVPPPQFSNASPTELTRTIQLLVEDVRDQPANKFIQELFLPCVGDLPTGEWLVNGHDLLKALQDSPSSLNGDYNYNNITNS